MVVLITQFEILPSMRIIVPQREYHTEWAEDQEDIFHLFMLNKN